MPKNSLEDYVTFHNGKGITVSNTGTYSVYGSNGKVGFFNDYLYEGALIVGRVGAYCGSVQLSREKFWATDNTIVLKTKANVDLDYLYHLLSAVNLNKVAGGSAQPLITHGFLKNVKLSIPDLPIQKNIGSFFTLIDQLIENSLQKIQVLEDTVRLLYNYWFLQFDFPSNDGKPYKSAGGKMKWEAKLDKEIPSNWELKSLADLQPILTGKEDANFATKKGSYAFFTCADEVFKCDEFAFEGKAVLLAGNGNFNIKLYEGKFNAYQRTYVLIPNDPKYYTIVYLALQDVVKSLANGSRGSIVKFITKGDIEGVTIALPQSGFDDEYAQLNELTSRIEKLAEEVRKLQEIKEFLLPIVMNDQVVVI